MQRLSLLKLKIIFPLYLLVLATGFIGVMMMGFPIESLVLLIFILLTGFFILLMATTYYLRLEKKITENQQNLMQSLIEKNANALKQMENLQHLHSFIKPVFPLPNTGGWAASPDLLAIIFKQIIINKPSVIIELGSGTSTLYIGHLLKDQNIKGKLFSVDHDPIYAMTTRENVKHAGLDEQVAVYTCPIEPLTVKGKEWLWYGISKMEIPQINFLIVDGPIGSLQKKSRYPAMPLLFEKLAPGAIIILDDYNRPDEQALVQDWLNEFPELKQLPEVFTEKGAALIIKAG